MASSNVAWAPRAPLQKPVQFLSQFIRHSRIIELSRLLLTIPNLFTMIRVLMTPFILYELAHGRFISGGWLFGVAAFTDLLDGAIARRFGGESRVGLYLDPIADKILLNSSVYIGLAANSKQRSRSLGCHRNLWPRSLDSGSFRGGAFFLRFYVIPQGRAQRLGEGKYVSTGDDRGCRDGRERLPRRGSSPDLRFPALGRDSVRLHQRGGLHSARRTLAERVSIARPPLTCETCGSRLK